MKDNVVTTTTTEAPYRVVLEYNDQEEARDNPVGAGLVRIESPTDERLKKALKHGLNVSCLVYKGKDLFRVRQMKITRAHDLMLKASRGESLS